MWLCWFVYLLAWLCILWFGFGFICGLFICCLLRIVCYKCLGCGRVGCCEIGLLDVLVGCLIFVVCVVVVFVCSLLFMLASVFCLIWLIVLKLCDGFIGLLCLVNCDIWVVCVKGGVLLICLRFAFYLLVGC